MDSINSLLIIASAFSVFGQYLDNSHNHEIEKLRSTLSGIDLSDADHDLGLAKVREKWDDFMIGECLRAKPFVIALFFYLLSVVLFIAVVNSLSSYYHYNVSKIRHIDHFMTAVFGSVLLIVSSAMTRRLISMMREKGKKQAKSEEIMTLYSSVRASIDSHKQ